jgi:large subunit ribosomal protein L21
MYAIVEIAGQQFKVEAGKKIFVHRLEDKEGTNIEFDRVLLIEDEGKVTVGEPTIKNAVIEGKILDHMRGDKIIIFKKKRKKGYRIKNGHRQNFTQVEIISINGKGTDKKVTAEKEEVKVVEVKVKEKPIKAKKTVTEKTTDKKEKPKVKKTAGEKTTGKKPAQKKASKGKE